jgi:hypothetical protein
MTKQMKYSTMAILTVMVAIAAILFFNTATTKADEPELTVINKLFDDYFKAIKNADVETAISLVIDTRWSDIETQRVGYQAAAKEDVIYSVKVLSIESAADSEYGKTYNAKLFVKNKTNGEFEITLPVVNVGGWKILIKPTDIPPATQLNN